MLTAHWYVVFLYVRDGYSHKPKNRQFIQFSCICVGCSSTQFQCSSGQCVSSSVRCNGRTGGCSDGSDERNCRKFSTYMLCTYPILLNLVISALFHITCTVSCQSGAFRCSNGQCILSSDRCDGNLDCTDGSDETGCGKMPKLPIIKCTC